tara:strand:- start:706 stop:1401 length:696 start_codon:yes stop_codon:yes gene_type:complete
LLVDVVIPAFNEQGAINNVIADIPKDLTREIIVVDNNSSDKTAEIANKAGAKVLFEKNRGYGCACLKGVDYIKSKSVKPDLVVFIDGDYSDYPSQMKDVIEPIVSKNADMVIGSRSLGNMEPQAMPFQQRFGNWLSTSLIYLIYRYKYTDLGPFRAIKFNRLIELKMQDKTFGWTVEMQLKAVKKKMHIIEVPVNYRQRIGVSKISGTFKGTILAGYKIIVSIFKYAVIKI